jgi:hypothetical protein
MDLSECVLRAGKGVGGPARGLWRRHCDISGKWSSFPDSGDISVGWQRWFKRTVWSGAKQVWGAERLLRDHTSTLYLDAACKTLFPLLRPDGSHASFHLVVVTHGGSRKCRDVFGGSGSFMIDTHIRGFEQHDQPFTIGELDRTRTFVHVMDDTTLNILMRTLDTIIDLTAYLRKKEALLRGNTAIMAAGDEELLANYLKNVNTNNEHDFDFRMPASQAISALSIDEGFWSSFVRNPQRLAQVEQDKISYLWDDLIERFNHHALAGTQYQLADTRFTKCVSAAEQIVRFMARESRFRRRVLSQSIIGMIETTPANFKRVRVLPPSAVGSDMCYVFLLFPAPSNIPSGNPVDYDEYRIVRARFLEGTCMVAKLKFPDAKHIIGIATESGDNRDSRSEDAIYLDATEWSAEMQDAAQGFQSSMGVLTNPTEHRVKAKEYPDVVSREEFLRNPRNKPCPCGSGRKYKKCCLQRGRTFYN